ncbi:MAG: T9SS type A sorting domain-containing protein [Flavobacteriaceae bacterium]
MKIRLHYCLFLILQMVSVQSQQFNWATHVTGEEFQLGVKSVKDAQGNTYIIGYSTGPFEYNGVTYAPNGSADAFFAKLDNNKALVWMKSVGGNDAVYYDSPQDIHIDPFGDIYLTFTSCGNNFTYDGQILSGINSPGQYSGEAVLLKVNSDGNYIWHDSGTVDSSFQAITTDDNGNVYVTGNFYESITLGGSITLNNPSTGTTRDFLVAKYQPNGTIVWAKRAGGLPHNTFAYGFDLEINPQTNEVIVLGKGEGAVYFGGVPLPTNGVLDKAIVLISYNMNGTQNWVKQVLNGYGYGYGISLDISNSGIIGVGGQIFDSGLVGFYNSDGSVISEQTYFSPSELRVDSITFNEFHDAYISGWCDAGGTLGISPGTVTLSSTTAFIAKIDVLQQVKWVEQFEGSRFANRVDYENGIITYAGRIDNMFTYNSGQNVIHNNAGDALFGEVIDHQLLTTASFLPENIVVYPNPTSGFIAIEANALQQIEIYNINGKRLENTNKSQIDLSQYPCGIYFLKIISNKGSTLKKVVLK